MISITNSIPVVFRHIHHLNNAVQSILNQTVLPNEVIIIISEFVENEISLNIINEIEQKMKDKNISIIINTYANIQYSGKNRQIAYDLCSSDIIIFQDCDDIAHPQRNEILLHVYMNTQIPHILHGWTSNLDALNKHIEKKEIMLTDQINKQYHTQNGTPFICKKIVGNLTFPNYRKGQDRKLNDLISSKFKSILVLNNDIYIYQNHNSSWSNRN